MAVTIVVPGRSLIKIQAPNDSLVELGYTRNESEIILRPYYHPVHSDRGGGDPGPPIDWQLLGVDALIRLRLSEIDTDAMDVLEAFASTGTAGTIPTAGTLMVAGNNYLRVLIHSTSDPRNFPICVPISPIEWNHGTKYKEASLEFAAIKNNSGLLWNDTTS